jgi:hypothetical protein
VGRKWNKKPQQVAKSLVAVAKNATAQSPLKKLHVGTESPLKKFRR